MRLRRPLLAFLISALVTVALAVPSAAAPGGAKGKPPKSPKPTPSVTATPTPTPTPTPGGVCYAVMNDGCPLAPIDGHSGYLYPKSNLSNGWNTYVLNDGWACGDGSCGPQSITVTNPGLWSVTSDQTAGNTSVRSYPNVQQLTTVWDGSGFNGYGPIPVGALASISSSYAETMNDTSGVIGQAAYDIWTTDTRTPEVMIWVDTAPGRQDVGGSTRIGAGTIGGIPFTYYNYQGVLPILKLDANLQAGTIDILDGLHYLQSHGVLADSAALQQINFGWEICSTGGEPKTFNMNDYSLTLTPK